MILPLIDDLMYGGWNNNDVVVDAANTSYIQKGLTTGASYSFRVIAVNAAGQSNPSEIVRAVPGSIAPATLATALINFLEDEFWF